MENENGKCHFCDNDATTTRECDDGKTHPVCVGCATAWYDDNVDAHMERYITNRNARTGQTWRVVERYATDGNGKRCAVGCGHWGYERAIIANEHGERARIWYYGPYWRAA